MAYSSTEPAASRPPSGVVSPPQQRIRSRTQSISSDRPSNGACGMMSPPLPVSPEAAFIASSAASQIVTNDHDSHLNTWYDEHGIEPSGETALVSAAALQLVNSFLDQLLFNFLSISRSTSLTALRPAVTEVLKPKLAKDAINQADEELREYLGGGDDDDMLQSQATRSSRDWDLELVWKRTRLRCMVYSSLGDMEEEDEDFYMEQEHLEGGDETLGENVSPAVAIFLTSILEFMGEQALISAGQAAYQRMRFIYEKERKKTPISPPPIADRITIEEVDMDRVAFDRTIGRLWRAWKKRIRSPTADGHPSLHRPSMSDISRGFSHYRGSSMSTDDGAYFMEPASLTAAMKDKAKKHKLSYQSTLEEGVATDEPPPPPQTEKEWLAVAAAIPLPLGVRDIAEILMPGFASYSDDDEANGADDENDGDGKKRKLKKKQTKDKSARPKSLMILPVAVNGGLPTPTLSEPRTPEVQLPRKRANSLPTPSTSPYLLLGFTPVVPDEVAEPSVEADDNKPVPASDEERSDAAAPISRKEKRKLVKPLQTALIGAAVTTVSPRAVPVGSMAAKIVGTENEDEIDDDIDFTEEPQIMTSSRVSISGRSSSPSTSDHGRPLSIVPVLPTRPPSIHSPRVIEVTGPRSPIMRSRGSSVEALDSHSTSRNSNASRTSSISNTPIVEEGHSPADTTPATRSSYVAVKPPRVYTNESISEAEEISAGESALPAQSTKRHEATPSHLHVAQPAYNSVVRTADPSSPLYPPPPPAAPNYGKGTTKVTILSSSNSAGSFYVEDKPEVPPKPPAKTAARDQVAPSAVQTPPHHGGSGVGVPPKAAAASPAAGTISATALASTAATAAAAAAAAAATRDASPPREIPLVTPRAAKKPVAAPATNREEIQEDSRADSREENWGQSREQARAEAQAQLQGLPPAPAASRQLSHASASSSSSSSNKLKPKQSSEDVRRPEDVARNFEQLIQSDQTIQYTLTPENMRAIDGTRPSMDSISVRQRGGDRSRSSSVGGRQMDVKRSASTSRSRAPESAGGVKLNGPVPRSHGLTPSITSTSTSSKMRVNGVQARDARIARESMSDFADFIRSSGPTNDSPVNRRGPPPLSNAMRNVSNPASISKRSLDSGRTTLNGNSPRRRYEAREATVDKDDNSDLIDFIRRGPPTAMGNPRIPRTVAPFRSTMDSDQMVGAVGGRAVDASLPDVRYSGTSTSVTESSMGSQTGLLKKTRPSPPNMGGAGSGPFGEPDMPMPKRKTRRVRDPYAIDLSDEEDEELFSVRQGGGRTGMPPPVKEESLVDFLNSVPPPVNTTPVLFDIPQTRNAKPRKKASAPSLMSRFTRSSGNTSPRLPFGGSSNNQSSSSFHHKATESRSLSSRAGSIMSRTRGHTPLQVNMPPGFDKYGVPPVPPMVSGGNQGHRPVLSSAGRVPMKRFEPREAQHVSSRATQDLADFFRDSGPDQPFRR